MRGKEGYDEKMMRRRGMMRRKEGVMMRRKEGYDEKEGGV